MYVDRDNDAERFFKMSQLKIIVPVKYEKGLTRLTAESPAVSFEDIYDRLDIAILIAQSKKGPTYCGAFHPQMLRGDEFKKIKGPTYLTIRSGEGKIGIGGDEINVKPLDVLLLRDESFVIPENGLATTVMTSNFEDISHLIT